MIRALVVEGLAWGIGDTDARAFRDALAQGLRGDGIPSTVERGVPWARDRALFVPVTLEEAKRIVAGDIVLLRDRLAS